MYTSTKELITLRNVLRGQRLQPCMVSLIPTEELHEDSLHVSCNQYVTVLVLRLFCLFFPLKCNYCNYRVGLVHYWQNQNTSSRHCFPLTYLCPGQHTFSSTIASCN